MSININKTDRIVILDKLFLTSEFDRIIKSVIMYVPIIATNLFNITKLSIPVSIFKRKIDVAIIKRYLIKVISIKLIVSTSF